MRALIAGRIEPLGSIHQKIRALALLRVRHLLFKQREKLFQGHTVSFKQARLLHLWRCGRNHNRIDARNFDQAQFKDARDYQTALEQWNKQFGFTVGNSDRNFNAQTLQQLANMGLTATGGNVNAANLLSTLFGQNTMTGATAGAGGTVGQANNWMSLLNSLLGYNQNSRNSDLLNTIVNSGGKTTTPTP